MEILKTEKFIKLRKNCSTLPNELFRESQLTRLEIIAENLEELDSQFENLFNLEFLSLNCKNLTSVSFEIFSLPKLKYLKIFNSKMMYLPSPSSNQKINSAIEHLFLNNNQIEQLPKQYCNLTRLQTLDLSGNKLKALPNQFDQLKQLSRLSLERNEFKEVPLGIYNLKKLNHLALDGNPLTDDEKLKLQTTFGIWF